MLLHTEIEFVKSKIVHYHCPVGGNTIGFVHYLQSHSSKKTQTKSMKAKKISINIQETIHRKSTHTSLKIFDFEKKRCSKLHFAEAQPQLVLNLFLTFDKF